MADLDAIQRLFAQFDASLVDEALREMSDLRALCALTRADTARLLESFGGGASETVVRAELASNAIRHLDLPTVLILLKLRKF